jgi:hypothetical protein
MANKQHKKKPAISSKVNKLPMLDWGPASRNHKNLKRIEQAIQEEQNFAKNVPTDVDCTDPETI